MIDLLPRLSEKTYAQSQSHNVYVFEVPKAASKQSVATAVANQFKVQVIDVNVLNVKGKTKRSVRKGGRATYGKRADFKKAYVTLKSGDSIPIFTAEEETAEAKKEKK